VNGEGRFPFLTTGPETPQRYEELRKAVDEHCPVLEVFANKTAVETSISVD
jgi:hypothetical protein